MSSKTLPPTPLSAASPSPDYAVPTGLSEVCYEIKKSRFIARAALAETREQAMAMLAKAKSDFPDARHHCWAYQFGNPKSAASAAMSDDGEPSGTAGKPILNVLQHKEVGNVMIVVIRYFGGVKLGAGGLVRAYSTAAQMVMDDLETVQQIARELHTLRCGFGDEQSVRHWLSLHDGVLEDIQYEQQVLMVTALPSEHGQAFNAFVASMGATLLPK